MVGKEREYLMDLVRFQRDAWRKITPKEMHDFYASDEDIESMKEWPIQRCREILNDIMIHTLEHECGSIDRSTNPFCLFAKVNCKICDYGKKHGICTTRGSNRNSFQRYFRDNDIDEFEALSNKKYRNFFKSYGLKLKNRKKETEEE